MAKSSKRKTKPKAIKFAGIKIAQPKLLPFAAGMWVLTAGIGYSIWRDS